MTARQDARSRILLFFLLGIALPSGLLGYLAFRGIQNDRALVERERRVELEETAARIDGAAEARVTELARRVDRAPQHELSGLVRGDSALEAVFVVGSDGAVRVVAAEGLVFDRTPALRRTASPAEATSPDPFEGLLRSARRRELREGDLEAALELYGRAAEEAPGAPERARALGGVGRVQRKLDHPDEAIATYERLRDEFGDVTDSSGIPTGPAASLELGSLLLEAGDTAQAASVLLTLYDDLVRGRWRVTPAHFELLTGEAAVRLDTLERAGWASDGSARLAASGAGRESHDSAGAVPDTTTPTLSARLSALRAKEAAQRARARALLAFEEAGLRGTRVEAGGARRFTVPAEDRSLPAVLLPTTTGSEGTDRRGLILDLSALATPVIDRTPGEDDAGFTWTLRGADGEVVARSPAAPTVGSPSVFVELAGFSGWVLELSPSATASVGGFLTSRRAIYLYAFLLLAGILLSGLILTIRSVTRELELARMKSDFVSTVSHEFKSPLTAIRQLAEMLSSGRVPSEERRRRYYDTLLEQSERLSMLVDNVLDFARMEAGREDLSPEPVDLAELVEDTVSEARRRVAHEDFAIKAELEHPLPTVHLDRKAVRQALDNLIDNGVKYSGSSREVVVRALAENGEVVLAVRDFGIGLAPDEADRVFERFYRAGDELTRSVKGTGLGLTLVKQIVDAHGGRAEVRSEPGEGSTFVMRFPVEPGKAP